MKKTMIMAVVASLGFASAALAADPVKLTCPAGSAQKLVAGENFLCTNGKGKIVAGPEVMLYPSGKKMAEGQVDANGSRTGTWTLFNESGVKTHSIDFANGDFHGKWTEFHSNGMTKKVVQYQAGAHVGQDKEFDLQGKEIGATTATK